jgi:hypothetical protein
MPDLETLVAPEVELSEFEAETPEPDEILDLEGVDETEGEADPLASLDDDALRSNPRVAAILAQRDAEEATKLEQARKDTEFRIRQSEHDKAMAIQFQQQQDLANREVIALAKNNLREVFRGLKQRLLDGDDTAEIDEKVLDEHAQVYVARARVEAGNEQFTAFQRWAETRMPGFMQSVPPSIQEAYWRARHAGDHPRALLVLQDAMLAATVAATEKRVLEEQAAKTDKEAKTRAEADAARGARREAVGASAPSRPVGSSAANATTRAEAILRDFTQPREKRQAAYKFLYGFESPSI